MSRRSGAIAGCLGALLFVTVLSACGPDGGPGAGAPLPAGVCPADVPADERASIIDWVPFVVVGETMFSAENSPESVLADDRVGAVVATVRCRIGDAVDDPEFQPRDGDAAYLPVGTRLHAVIGTPVTAELAVREDGEWRRYTARESD